MKATRKKFIDEYNLQNRREQAMKQLQKYSTIEYRKPNSIPLIIERHSKSDLPELEKNRSVYYYDRFTCDNDSRFIKIVKIIEHMVNKTPASGQGHRKDLFVYVNNTIPHSEHIMSDIYKKHEAQDGYLYLTYRQMERF